MSFKNINPENTEFVILSFEGPDPYSLAGGLGVRTSNLSETLSGMGFKTHLFFIGDPKRPGREKRFKGRLILHRWCQWISEFYPGGVYQGENEKLYDFNESIPSFVCNRIVKPACEHGKLVVILGEEWHTAEAMSRLSDLLHTKGLRDRVVMFWNANNTFSFHRINWSRLSYGVTITTVSRYMKYIMWKVGVNPLVIPNGIPNHLFRKVQCEMVKRARKVVGAELMLCKVARWDPDKRWNAAVEATARLKKKNIKTVLIARGGVEPHGREVMYNARNLGLTVKEARTDSNTFEGYLGALEKALPADVIDIKFHVPQQVLSVAYRASDGVLANSGHEPFGLVGLETMAAGGIALTGCTGEDYARPFINSFVMETADPLEIVNCMTYLKRHPEHSSIIRKTARNDARNYTWDMAVRNLNARLANQAQIQGVISKKQAPYYHKPAAATYN